MNTSKCNNFLVAPKIQMVSPADDQSSIMDDITLSSCMLQSQSMVLHTLSHSFSLNHSRTATLDITSPSGPQPRVKDSRHLLYSFTGIHQRQKKNKMQSIRGVLIDVSGTVHVGDKVIPGAVQALDRLRASGIPVKSITPFFFFFARFVLLSLLACRFY